MPNRTAPAASITVTASLASGMAAFAATTNPEALSFQSVGASTTAPSATARSGVTAPGASAVADLGPATTTESPGPAATTPTNGSALFSSAGSDDRLSEAVRHTREASCHGQGHDD